jgi:hypothetical protein
VYAFMQDPTWGVVRAISIESPIQRLLKVWENDSRSLQLQPVVAPVAGGAYLGVEGRY